MRNGTKASLMIQIDEQIKKQRARTLLELSKQLELDYMKKYLDKEVEVLIETNNENYALGHTTNYLNIKIYNSNKRSGDLVKVRLKSIEYPFIIGTEE